MENNKIYDVIVIGGGPGGYTAALYSARAELSTLVLEKFSPGGQMATTDIVENYPGFPEGISGFELGLQMKAGAERFGVKSKLAEVLSVDLESNPKVIKTKKQTYEAKTVILATGAFPRELGLPNERELDIVDTVNLINDCHCDGVKIHSTFVLKNTRLADMLSETKYTPISLEYYTDKVVKIISHLNKEIVIHRITGDPPKDKLIAPLWANRKKIVINEINKRLNELNVFQGDRTIKLS